MRWRGKIVVGFILGLFISGIMTAEASPMVKKITEGVYEFSKEQYNSIFIVTAEGVIVVDPQLTTATAKEIAQEIKKVTDKPVKYVINTHHHLDHILANQVFADTAEIIAHAKVRENLIKKGDKMLEEFRASMKKKLEDAKITLPTITFEKKCSLYLGDKIVQIMFLGRSETEDNCVVYLPKEKILFTSDIVSPGFIGWRDMHDAFTKDWIETLANIEKINFTTLVPGHGEVSDKSAVSFFKQYLIDLRAEVKKFIDKGSTLEEAKKKASLPQYQNIWNYKEHFPLNVEKVYKEMKQGM